MVVGPVPRRCWWRVVSPATSPRHLERYKKADDYGHEKEKRRTGEMSGLSVYIGFCVVERRLWIGFCL